MAERQLADEIIVLEGIGRGKKTTGRSSEEYAALINFPFTGINETPLSQGGDIENGVDIVADYRYQPDLVVKDLILKSRQLKKVAADRFKVAIKARDSFRKNRNLADRLSRVGVSLASKNKASELPKIKKRFLEASGRTIGYARLEALASVLAGSAATQAVLLEAASYALMANRKAHANRYLARRHKIGRKTREIIDERTKYNGASVIAINPANKNTPGFGNIFEDFINLFKEIINAIKNAISDIKREFLKLSCELCDVLQDQSFQSSAKIAAMVIGGPEASAKLESAISEAGKYLQCEGCIALIQEKQREAEEFRIKIQQRALEIIGLQIQWNPNIVLFKRQLVDTVRHSVRSILIREHNFRPEEATEIANGLISIDNLRQWQDQWLNLHPEDRVKIHNTPFVTGAFSQDEWATIYGVALKMYPGFENLGFIEKWHRLKELADKWNCETTGNTWGAGQHPNPRYPGHGICVFTSESNQYKWIENYRYYKDIIGIYDYRSEVNVNNIQKWWTDRVPEDYGKVQAAINAQNQIVVNAQQVTEFLKAVNAAMVKQLDLLAIYPDSKPYAEQANKMVIGLKSALPNIEPLVAQVKPYNPSVSTFLNNEIIAAKNSINRGTSLILIYMGRQIQNERIRLNNYADSQARVAVQMVTELYKLIQDIETNYEQSKVELLRKLRPVVSHQREILVTILTEAQKMNELAAVNKVTAAIDALNKILVLSGKVVYDRKPGIKVEPAHVAAVAAAAAAPLLLLLL